MLTGSQLGKIIQCHIDRDDPETFVVGRLLSFDTVWFLMHDITPSGRWNGIAAYMQSDIVQIEDRTDYLQRINTLLRCRGENQELPSMKSPLLLSMLTYASDTNRIIGAEINASGVRDVNGFVEDMCDHSVCIHQLDEYGRNDGKSWIHIDAITRCYIGDDESMCLEMLFNHF